MSFTAAIMFGVLLGLNTNNTKPLDVNAICKSMKLEISDCKYDTEGNLVISYSIQYQPHKSQPKVLYYDRYNWVHNPFDRAVFICKSDDIRTAMAIDESAIVKPRLDVIRTNKKEPHKVLQAGETIEGHVVVPKEHLQKALKNLEVTDRSKFVCMLSLNAIGQTYSPVVSEWDKAAGTTFYRQNASGEWMPFQLPDDSGDVLIRGIQGLKKLQSAKEQPAVAMPNTTKEHPFTLLLSSDWSKAIQLP